MHGGWSLHGPPGHPRRNRHENAERHDRGSVAGRHRSSCTPSTHAPGGPLRRLFHYGGDGIDSHQHQHERRMAVHLLLTGGQSPPATGGGAGIQRYETAALQLRQRYTFCCARTGGKCKTSLVGGRRDEKPSALVCALVLQLCKLFAIEQRSLSGKRIREVKGCRGSSRLLRFCSLCCVQCCECFWQAGRGSTYVFCLCGCVAMALAADAPMVLALFPTALLLRQLLCLRTKLFGSNAVPTARYQFSWSACTYISATG